MNPPTAAEAANIAYRVVLLEKTIETLERKVDRLVWALVSLALSIAASAIVFALTVAGLQ